MNGGVYVDRSVPLMGQPLWPGAEGPTRPVPSGSQIDGAASARRNHAINRLVTFNHRHANLAWDNRRAQPVCPHGLAFLYREPGINSPFEWIRAATAVFDADDDTADLPRLLYRLIGVAENHRAGGSFDPATKVAIHRDEPLRRGEAQLFGLAVSTLDTPTGPWAEQLRRAQDVNDLGGRCLLLLAEPPQGQGFIVVDRGAPRTARFDLIIRSTVNLSYQLGMSTRPWQQVGSMPELLVEDEVWRLMYRLHTLTHEQHPRPAL